MHLDHCNNNYKSSQNYYIHTRNSTCNHHNSFLSFTAVNNCVKSIYCAIGSSILFKQSTKSEKEGLFSGNSAQQDTIKE